MPIINIDLSSGQRDKIIRANKTGKNITLQIKKSNMNGQIPVPVSQLMADRHEINSKRGKGMLLKLTQEDISGEGFLDILTKPLKAVIKTAGKPLLEHTLNGDIFEEGFQDKYNRGLQSVKGNGEEEKVLDEMLTKKKDQSSSEEEWIDPCNGKDYDSEDWAGVL